MKFSRLLVLCEANICRSPLAAHLLQNLTDLRIDSAGLTAREGDAADPIYLNMAQTLGLDLTEHRSKPVNRELLTEADLILVMTGAINAGCQNATPSFRVRLCCSASG